MHAAAEVLSNTPAIARGSYIDPRLLDFLTMAYSAFRLGQATSAAQPPGVASGEAARLNAEVDRYAASLSRQLTLANEPAL